MLNGIENKYIYVCTVNALSSSPCENIFFHELLMRGGGRGSGGRGGGAEGAS